MLLRYGEYSENTISAYTPQSVLGLLSNFEKPMFSELDMCNMTQSQFLHLPSIFYYLVSTFLRKP
jgi:hypothetical protein